MAKPAAGAPTGGTLMRRGRGGTGRRRGSSAAWRHALEARALHTPSRLAIACLFCRARRAAMPATSGADARLRAPTGPRPAHRTNWLFLGPPPQHILRAGAATPALPRSASARRRRREDRGGSLRRDQSMPRQPPPPSSFIPLVTGPAALGLHSQLADQLAEPHGHVGIVLFLRNALVPPFHLGKVVAPRSKAAA